MPPNWTPAWTNELLGFWFIELQPKQWFEKDLQLDQLMRERFLTAYEETARSFVLDHALGSSDAALAHVILLDQLPRNMFRGTPRAFESDAKALSLATDAVARGLDMQVEAVRRTFLYLPFEHSEALADQVRSVELFTALGDVDTLKFARAHHDIIARFGRFPHRNAILGRPSTPQEIAFLALPGSGF